MLLLVAIVTHYVCLYILFSCMLLKAHICLNFIKWPNSFAFWSWIRFIIFKKYFFLYVSKRRKRASRGKNNFVWPLSWQRHDNHSFPLALGLLCHKLTNAPNIFGILNKSLITFSIGAAWFLGSMLVKSWNIHNPTVGDVESKYIFVKTKTKRDKQTKKINK